MTYLTDNKKKLDSISAIILGAGQSQRMGQPKLLLPWGKRTIIEQILLTIRSVDIRNITVVLGPDNQELESLLEKLKVQIVYNPFFMNNQMMASLKAGLLSQAPSIEASLVVLGDQPGIEENIVEMIIDRYYEKAAMLVVPSFNNHRGHPWLIQMSLNRRFFEFAATVHHAGFLIQACSLD